VDRIRIADFGHPGGIITWLGERGFEAASFGTDGFGDHQGILFSRAIADGAVENHIVLVHQALVWDGENVVVEDA